MKLEDRLPEALTRIADSTPVSDPGVFDPDTLMIAARQTPGRPSRLLVGAVAAIVLAGVGGLVLLADRPTADVFDTPNPPAAQTSPAPTLQSTGTTAPQVSTSTPATSASSPAAPGDEPGPVGAMVLPDTTSMHVDRADNNLLSGTSPMRWYATNQARPETGPYLQLVTSQNSVPIGTELGCLLAPTTATTQASLDDGTPVCLLARDPTNLFGRLALNRSPYTIFIEGNATDPELITAANHVVPSDTGPGFEISAAGLPIGVTQTGAGWQVSDFGTTSLDGAYHPVVLAGWTDDAGRLLFYAATQEDPSWMANHRLDFDTVTDVTVRGVPAFLRTITGQPSYLGLVWHENGTTFQVGSQGLSQSELLEFAEQMRPATVTEWNAMSAEAAATGATLDAGEPPESTNAG